MDGVLTEPPPQHETSWRHMKGPERQAWKAHMIDFYRTARPLFVPAETNFHVISARKDQPDVRELTRGWLAANLPERVASLTLFTGSRSIENVVAYKAATILALGIRDFTEDNPKIVKGLRVTLGGRCRVWLYRRGEISLA
jgi:hypothetical protein